MPLFITLGLKGGLGKVISVHTICMAFGCSSPKSYVCDGVLTSESAGSSCQTRGRDESQLAMKAMGAVVLASLRPLPPSLKGSVACFQDWSGIDILPSVALREASNCNRGTCMASGSTVWSTNLHIPAHEV